MLAQLKSRLFNAALGLMIRLNCTIIVFHTVGRSLIIKLIVSQFIVMAAHDSDISDTFSFIHSFPWIFTILICKFSDRVEDRSSRRSADLPARDTEPIFHIGIDSDSFEADRRVLEVCLVRGLHLELLKYGVAQAEMRVLRV